ncbi:MAG: MFS transporter [Muribaculaceae bacterium]|nr:MFS transporter [Muribaculaceae bacterium]
MRHQNKSSRRFNYIIPMIVMAAAGFTFNTSEMIPVGLLSDIGADLGVSEAKTGLLITAYAWVVALLSLPLMLAFARVPYRKLMLGIIAVFIVSHIISTFACSYNMLLASRIGVALTHCIFWSIAPAMIVAVAPPDKRASALSVLVAGGGMALIVGLPMGRLIGLIAGWRTAFGSIGILAILLFILMRMFYPDINREADTVSRKQLIYDMLHSPQLLMIYLIIGVTITGYYTGYSYIEPFLAQIGGFSESAITWTLTLFGVAGLLGSLIAGECYPRHSRAVIIASCFGIPFMLMMLRPAADMHPMILAALCIPWGIAITTLNIALQNDIVRLFPLDSAVPMSIYSGTFNLGIGAGALVGGIATNNSCLGQIGYIGGSIAVCTAIFCLMVYIPARRRAFSGSNVAD